LRIRLPFLEAIERGDLAALPGAAYQAGFVRTYAQTLGLDGDEILRRFRAEGNAFVQKAELSFLAPVPDSAVPTGAIVLVGVVLVLVGYGLWYHHTAQEARLAAAIPSIPAELAPLAVPPKPPVASPPAVAQKPVAVAPRPPQAAPAGAAPPVAQTTTPSAAPAASTAIPKPATPVPSGAAPAGTGPAGALANAPSATPAATATPTPATPAPGLVIMATGDDWVEVQDAKGNILLSKTLHSGDSWPVPDLPGLTMTAGNAGSTMIANNGKTGSPLGAAGSVVRDYPLTPTAPNPAGGTPAGSVAPATPDKSN
jgi:cytoskeleton protein RodZ